MDHAEMQRLLRQKPFQPFRVFVSDGRLYEVRHPRMNLLGPTFIKIGLPAADLPPPICERAEYVRLDQIQRVELLPGSAPLEEQVEPAECPSNGGSAVSHDEMQRLLRQRPFQPFRVFVSDGRVYDVRHPRMNLLATSFIKIGVPAPDLPEPICDHTEYVQLDQILRVEPLAPPSA